MYMHTCIYINTQHTLRIELSPGNSAQGRRGGGRASADIYKIGDKRLAATERERVGAGGLDVRVEEKDGAVRF